MQQTHDAIKAGVDKKLAATRARKAAQPMPSLEKQLIEQFGLPMKIIIGKNDAGHFRIPFHDRAHMQTILDKLGLKISEE